MGVRGDLRAERAVVVTEEHLRRIGGCELLVKPPPPSEAGRVVQRALSVRVG